jgi:ribokinase
MTTHSLDIVGLGEVVVDWVAQIPHFPSPDEKIDSTHQDLFSGGVTANYAVAAARLGARTGFIGAVGDDEQAQFLLRDFAAEGVDTTWTLRKAGARTPVNFIFVVETSGEKVIIQSPYMQTTRLEPPDLVNLEDYLRGVKLLHTTAIHPEATLETIALAKRLGVKVSLDLEAQIAVRGLPALRPILEQVDILLPNKAGAMKLTGTDSPGGAARALLDMGIPLVVTTLGADGAAAYSADGVTRVGGCRIQPVDTTGAGDTFCAAFCTAYVVNRASIESAMALANAAAGLKCLKLGARPGMPTLAEARAFGAVQGLNLESE